jgi:hypothetical protein
MSFADAVSRIFRTITILGIIGRVGTIATTAESVDFPVSDARQDMQHFINAIKCAIANGNWCAALALALTMPDICGRLEEPSGGSQTRYVSWFDRYLSSRYRGHGGPDRTFHTLSGSDCYALRCAFLLQGEFGIEDQRAQQARDHFQFTIPRPGVFVHMTQTKAILQLQIDRFCLDMCKGVEQWLNDVEENTIVRGRMAALATIS